MIQTVEQAEAWVKQHEENKAKMRAAMDRVLPVNKEVSTTVNKEPVNKPTVNRSVYMREYMRKRRESKQ